MQRTEPLIQHRKSSGDHESGFGHFNSNSLSLGKKQIPAITVVDDTFEKHRDVMAEIIQRAKEPISK